MRRIFRHAAITAAAVAGLYGLVWLYDTSFRDPRFLDGWILAAGCLAQVTFSLRRNLLLARLGRVSVWMQLHFYMGYFVAACFALHTGFELPDGVLESTLWGVFVVLILSGIAGAYLTRTVPAKLTPTAPQIAFEEIPAARHALAHRVEGLALGAGGAASLSISELHANVLQGFFEGPRNMFAHLRRSGRPIGRVCSEIDGIEPYVDASGQKALKSIRALAIEKDELDDQYAHQLLLKAWLFVHVPATYGMIVLALVHIGVVYAYASGVP